MDIPGPLEQDPTEGIDAVVVVPELEQGEAPRSGPSWESTGMIISRGYRTTWGPAGMVIVREATGSGRGRPGSPPGRAHPMIERAS